MRRDTALMFQMQAHFGVTDNGPKTKIDCQLKGIPFRSILDGNFKQETSTPTQPSIHEKAIQTTGQKIPPIAPSPLKTEPPSRPAASEWALSLIEKYKRKSAEGGYN